MQWEPSGAGGFGSISAVVVVWTLASAADARDIIGTGVFGETDN
jgi:hypothetical protein